MEEGTTNIYHTLTTLSPTVAKKDPPLLILMHLMGCGAQESVTG